jgi:hypothetical protein
MSSEVNWIIGQESVVKQVTNPKKSSLPDWILPQNRTIDVGLQAI